MPLSAGVPGVMGIDTRPKASSAAPVVDHRRADPLSPSQRALAAGYVIIGLGYLAWRTTTMNPEAIAFSVLVYAAELFGFAASLLFLFVTWRLSVREAPPPDPNLLVDVLVVAGSQSLPELRRTLVACRRMRYPHATWLVDRVGLAEREELALELGLLYVGPTPQQPRGPFAGAMTRARGQAVAIFAGDHIPSREFLHRTLGYFADRRVGFVSTPLETYNLEAFEHRVTRDQRFVRSDRTVLNRILQRGRDHRNAVTAAGTGVIYRRTALDALNDLQLTGIDEDLDTSIRLHGDGWRGVYHAEVLAFRAAPDHIAPFTEHRARQRRHALQSWQRNGLALFAQGLSLPQRLCYLSVAFQHLDPWRRLVFYGAPIAALLTGAVPVVSLSIPLVLLCIAHYGLGLWVYEEASRGYGKAFELERHSMLRLSVLASSLLRRHRAPGRALASARRYLLPQSGVLAANAIAIPVGLAQGLSASRTLEGQEIALSVAWAGINTVFAGTALHGARPPKHARRRDYRFPIALPAMLNSHDTRLCTGVVDQLSAVGFRYYGDLPRPLSAGEFITGQILLPSGPHAFLAEVQSVRRGGGDPPVTGIGGSFIWPVPSAGDDLAALIYGTDLQWRLNRFVERTATPLEKVQRTGTVGRSTRTRHGRWAAAMCRTLDSGSSVYPGIVTMPYAQTRERTLVCFQRLLTKLPLRVRITSREGIFNEDGHAELFDAFTVDGVALYAYRFRPYGDPLGGATARRTHASAASGTG